MSLYRSSGLKQRTSSKFLNRTEALAVNEKLEKNIWLDHFYRTGGITKDAVTRFGPLGYPHFPVYACERLSTTFYEVAHWKLLQWQSELLKPTYIYLINLDFTPQKAPLSILKEKNSKDILNLNDYTAAHDWLLSKNSTPESITYPAIRDPLPGGVNFAIYRQEAVKDITFSQRAQMTILNQHEIQIIYENNSVEIIAPIR
jgi:hypothetical protein